MKKKLKYLGMGILVLIIGVIIFIPWYYDNYAHNSYPHVGIDPVMVNGELYFILPEGDKYGTEEIKVFPGYKPSWDKPLWGMNYTGFIAGLTKTEEREKIYPRLKQIKYGQNIEGFKKCSEPVKLSRDGIYYVEVILTRGRTTHEKFHIINDNRIIISDADSDKHPKDHIYSVVIEKDGKKISVPYSVSIDKNYYKIVVSESLSKK